jgi:hypothetical protein
MDLCQMVSPGISNKIDSNIFLKLNPFEYMIRKSNIMCRAGDMMDVFKSLNLVFVVNLF